MLFLASTAYAYTAREVLAATLVLEAGGEGKTGMLAVLSVIYNRADYRNLSPQEACLQKKQFSCFNSGIEEGIERAKKRNTWPLAYSLAGNFQGDIVKGADFYCTLNVNPSWTKKFRYVMTIGHHRFYCSK